MNDTYQPINCDDYDNLELACQHHLVLSLELKDGEVLQATATDAAELRSRVAETMATTLREEARLHRLWYDLRTQALFDDRFAASINEIDDSLAALTWKAVIAYAELCESVVIITPAIVYATADGLFHRALRDLITGDAEAVAQAPAIVGPGRRARNEAVLHVGGGDLNRKRLAQAGQQMEQNGGIQATAEPHQ